MASLNLERNALRIGCGAVSTRPPRPSSNLSFAGRVEYLASSSGKQYYSHIFHPVLSNKKTACKILSIVFDDASSAGCAWKVCHRHVPPDTVSASRRRGGHRGQWQRGEHGGLLQQLRAGRDRDPGAIRHRLVGLAAGGYTLTAIATDSAGATATSNAVVVNVVNNIAPVVGLIASPNKTPRRPPRSYSMPRLRTPTAASLKSNFLMAPSRWGRSPRRLTPIHWSICPQAITR